MIDIQQVIYMFNAIFFYIFINIAIILFVNPMYNIMYHGYVCMCVCVWGGGGYVWCVCVCVCV